MLDHRRHAPVAHVRRPLGRDPRPAQPRTYRGRANKTWRDIYEADHAESRNSGRFRWLVSTCVAAAVGAIAILVVIYGSNDGGDNGASLKMALRHIRESPAAIPATLPVGNADGGLHWSLPKSSRLVTVSGANSTRFVIHDTLKQRRNGREYIVQKPYIRIVSRLAPVPSNYADVIPPFNPFKLYAGNRPVAVGEEEGGARAAGGLDVAIKVVELLGGILPGEDGQELDAAEVGDIVERAKAADSAAAKGDPLDAVDAAAAGPAGGAAGSGKAGDRTPGATEPAPHNTTVFAKASSEAEDTGTEAESRDVRVVKVARGDTLAKILGRAGADTYLASEMVKSAAAIFPESALNPGQEVHIVVVPSLLDASRLEPAQFSVYADGHEHKVTVARSAAGEFVATATPTEAAGGGQLAGGADGSETSVYASIYGAGLVQSMTPDTIKQILAVHAYSADYRRRVRTGDQIESFFEAKDEGLTDGPPGELLYTAATIAGETTRFWRFRIDGLVDYYDENGNNSKKFLMRKPLRGEDVRLVSGFGMRFHPLLNERRMHTGVDWASPIGTPIIAAGNGVIEEAGRKGGYGNYLRIKHANGYQTAYGHLSRYAQGIAAGSKVRQGQVVAFVGCTGLCEGPHVHFEILVNNRFVDPLSISVPREKQLTGSQLAEFQKEHARIDELMRRTPVMTAGK